MHIDRLFRTMGPLAGLVALGALAGCNGPWDGSAGVPLAELDLSGDAPHAVALLGPDTVTITEGAQFAVAVDGDEAVVERLRFRLEGGTLGIGREGWRDWTGDRDGAGIATVRITMPSPRELSMAGSGRISSEALAQDAEISIAGSGTIETQGLASESLKVSIAGSGSYHGAGQVARLDVSIAGSGNAVMPALRADRAKVSIAGSGDVTFGSDGEVDANIMGSGNVTVRGSARCKVNSMGSGSLVCEREAQPAG